MCLLYASKMMHKYPDYLMFSGDIKSNTASDDRYKEKREALAKLNQEGLINFNNVKQAIDSINDQSIERCIN